MRKLQIAAIIFFIVVFSSCGDFLLPPLEVVSVKTANDSVTITMNKKPSVDSIRKAFSLSEEGVKLNGGLEFNKNVFIFYPFTGIKKNYEYSIQITTTAEDENGVSLLTDYYHTFYTKTDITNPFIKSFFPANETNIDDQPDTVVIEFSKKIDVTTFQDAVKITPVFDYLIIWEQDDSVVKLIPKKPLQKGTRYNVVISTDLRDVHRNPLLESFISTFLYGYNDVPPTMTLNWKNTKSGNGDLLPDTNNEYIPSDCSIEIFFSEEVNVETIMSNLEIIPTISFSVTPDFSLRKSASITFNQPPEWGRTYNIIIKKGMSGLSQNKIPDDSKYQLTFNNEYYRPVMFISGFLKNGSTYDKIGKETDFSSILLGAVNFPQNAIVATDLYFVFGISEMAESIILVSAMQNISISITNACVQRFAIRTMEIMTVSEYAASDLPGMLGVMPPNHKICALKLGVEITNAVGNGFIIFSLGQNIQDNLMNRMPAANTYTYNKQ
ncbi:MAG: Ig-like domain-containing protein [Treponema sp.]|jgi:hypothetical protein|nr:Ig-like domain-containing protein [Treponema sp.]